MQMKSVHKKAEAFITPAFYDIRYFGLSCTDRGYPFIHCRLSLNLPQSRRSYARSAALKRNDSFRATQLDQRKHVSHIAESMLNEINYNDCRESP